MNSITQRQIKQRIMVSLVSLAIIFVSVIHQAQAETSFNVSTIGKGKPVILIPGLMSSADVWQDTAKFLAQNHQVHLISIAGFAGQLPVENFSLLRVQQDLVNYIADQKLLKPTLIGHSLGGFLAMSIAVNYPESVARVVSVDGLPFIGPLFTQSNDTTVESLTAQAQWIKQQHQHMTPAQLAAQTQLGIARQATALKDQQRIITMAEQSDPKTVGEAIAYLMGHDLRGELGKISGKVLLIGASGAFSTDEQHNRVEQLYQEQLTQAQSAQLIMNPRSRHFIMYDDGDWLNRQLLGFLEGAK